MPVRPRIRAKRQPGTWDRGVDFRVVRRELARLLREHLQRKAFRSYCYAAVLLIQLRNGSRVSEALEAALRFAEEGGREVQVRVRKHKRETLRLMVLPEELKPRDLQVCRSILSEPRALERVKDYARKRLGVNSHSLRYAFITYLAKQGVQPQLIAKITGHAKLDYILRYTQRKKAEELLRDLNPS